MIRARWIGLALAASCLAAPPALGNEESSGAAEAPENDAFLVVWRTELTPTATTANEGRFAFKDNLLFEQDGFFTAEAFGPLGFDRAPYTLTELGGGALGFSSTMENGSQGTLVFNGVLQGGRITGTLVWTKPDGSVGTYNFTAEPDM